MPGQKGFLSPVLLIVIGVILLAGIGYFLFFNKTGSPILNPTKSDVTISGTIDLNGTPTQDSTIAIAEKKQGDNDFTVVIQNIPAVDGAKWSWNDAKKNTNYQIQAYLQSQGKSTATSEIKSITAPASGEILRLNVPVVKDSKVNSTISGSFDLNGYIPTGSIVTVFARKIGDPNFAAVTSGLPAVDGTGWSWGTAVSGMGYEVKAMLSRNGVTIAQSDSVVITAPSDDEVLRIISSAQAPVTAAAASISGKIDFNGAAQPGSSIVVLAKKTGTTTYNVVASGINAQDQAQWSWGGALPGVSYDLQAVLKSGNSDLAVSNTLTTAAPAANEVLVINSNYSQPQLPSPPQGPSISCAGQSNNLWSVNVTFNYVANGSQKAAQYWVRVGDPSSDNRYLDQRVAAQNQSGETQQMVSTSYVIGNGGTYYAKYAYSYNGSSGNLNDFSAWSGSTGFSCPAPTAVPTSTPTPTPTPTIPPAPTNIPQ